MRSCKIRQLERGVGRRMKPCSDEDSVVATPQNEDSARCADGRGLTPPLQRQKRRDSKADSSSCGAPFRTHGASHGVPAACRLLYSQGSGQAEWHQREL